MIRSKKRSKHRGYSDIVLRAVKGINRDTHQGGMGGGGRHHKMVKEGLSEEVTHH